MSGPAGFSKSEGKDSRWTSGNPEDAIGENSAEGKVKFKARSVGHQRHLGTNFALIGT